MRRQAGARDKCRPGLVGEDTQQYTRRRTRSRAANTRREFDWLPDYLGPVSQDGQPLTAKAQREKENAECVGGLRTPHRTVAKHGAMRSAGRAVRGALESFLERHPWVIDAMLDDGRSGWERVCDGHIAELLDRVGGALGTADTARSGRSQWRPGLVRAWCKVAEDPEEHFADWVGELGAPIGVKHAIPSSGIFPEVATNVGASDASAMFITHAPCSNYKSAEENAALVQAELERLEDLKYVKQWKNLGSPGAVCRCDSVEDRRYH